LHHVLRCAERRQILQARGRPDPAASSSAGPNVSMAPRLRPDAPGLYSMITSLSTLIECLGTLD
jgi:hypothetical protein